MRKAFGIVMAFLVTGLAFRAAAMNSDPLSAIGFLLSMFAWLWVAYSPAAVDSARDAKYTTEGN